MADVPTRGGAVVILRKAALLLLIKILVDETHKRNKSSVDEMQSRQASGGRNEDREAQDHPASLWGGGEKRSRKQQAKMRRYRVINLTL